MFQKLSILATLISCLFWRPITSNAQCDNINFNCNNFDILVDLAVDAANILSLCEGEPITFINQTTGNLEAIDSFVWIFNYLDAELIGQDCEITPSTEDITHVYNFEDSLICTSPDQDFVLLSVGLSAIDTNGCFSLVQSNEIVINILPRALFAIDNIICKNQNPNITNLSCPKTDNIEFEWLSMPDGQTATGFNPNFTYDTPGNYTVSLTATSITCDVEDTYTQTIQVLETPVPGFAIGNASTDSLCALLDTLLLIDNSINIDSSFWQITPAFNVTFLDDNQSGDSVYVIFESAGNYNFTLNAVNQGCTRNTSFNISVLEIDLLNVNNLPDCIDTNVVDLNNYTNFNGIPNTYTLTVTFLGDGSSQIFVDEIPSALVLPALGNYEIEVISESDCGTITRTGMFGYVQSFTISDLSTFCNNQDTVVNLNSLITPSTSSCLEWTGTGIFNDSLFSPVLAGEGVFNLRLRDCERLCIDERIEVTVLGTALNLAAFTACLSDEPISLDNIFEGQWSGNSVINDTLYTTLTGSGIFPIYFQSDTSSFCTLLDTIEVTIQPEIIADFTFDSNNCIDETISFINTSNSPVIIWDFGDGSTSTNEQPNYTYETAGSYAVELIVADTISGCSDTSFQIVNIAAPPVADFSTTIVDLNCDTVLLIVEAISIDTNSNYSWQIEGNVFQVDSLSFAIAIQDTFNELQIDLNVSNNCGSIDGSAMVTIPPGFYIDILFDSEVVKCAGDIVDFTLASNNVDSFFIDYGNGITANNEVLDIAYANNTDSIINYLVTIYGFSNACGADTATIIVPIQNNVPIASATFSENIICLGEPITFYNNSQFEEQAVIFFGDSNSAIFNIDSLTFTYQNDGVFNPYVVAFGCGTDTNYLDPITVAAKPVFNIETTPEFPCVNNTVTLITNGNIISPIWLLNEDTSASFVDSFTFVPTQAIEYEVVLIATAENNSFCSGSDTIFIKVGDEFDMNVEVLPTEGCAPLKVDVNASSTNTSVNYQIDFGNQQVSASGQTSTIYNNPGQYDLDIIGVSTDGCQEDTSIAIEVLEPFVLNAVNDTTILIGDAVALDFTTNQNFEDYIWFVGDSIVSSNGVRPLFDFPTNDAVYFIEVTGIDTSCSGLDSVLVLVECDELFLPDAFSPNNDGTNDALQPYTIFSEYTENENLSCIDFIDFSVFNRWGELVFYSESIERAWDGSYKGKALNAGIFTSIINYRIQNELQTLKKEIHLIK